jgi:hypothetical protein
MQISKSRSIALAGGNMQFKTAEHQKRKPYQKQLAEQQPFSPKSIFSYNQDNSSRQQ